MRSQATGNGLLPGRGFKHRVFSIHRSSRTHRSLGALLLTAAFAISISGLQAQTASPASPVKTIGTDYNNRYDLYAGFADSYFSTTIGIGNKTNLVGAGGQGTMLFSPIVGVGGRVSYVAGNIPVNQNEAGVTSTGMSETIFLFGPEIRLYRSPRWTVSGHGLIGGSYGIFDKNLANQKPPILPNSVGMYNNQLAFVYAAGGSYDYNYSPRLSLRIITDFQPSYFGHSVQKEFAGGVGVSYKLGTIRKK